VFESHDVIGHNHRIGDRFISGVKRLLKQHNLEEYFKIMGFNWSVGLIVNGPDKQPSMAFRTLFMQEMIRRGVLYQGILSPCYSHTEEDIDWMLQAFNESLTIFSNALDEGRVDNFLVGPEIKPVFREFN